MRVTAGTFLIAIVLALALGAVLGGLWLRNRTPPPDNRPITDTLQRIETQMRDFEAQRQHMGGLVRGRAFFAAARDRQGLQFRPRAGFYAKPPIEQAIRHNGPQFKDSCGESLIPQRGKKAP